MIVSFVVVVVVVLYRWDNGRMRMGVVVIRRRREDDDCCFFVRSKAFRCGRVNVALVVVVVVTVVMWRIVSSFLWIFSRESSWFSSGWFVLYNATVTCLWFGWDGFQLVVRTAVEYDDVTSWWWYGGGWHFRDKCSVLLLQFLPMGTKAVTTNERNEYRWWSCTTSRNDNKTKYTNRRKCGIHDDTEHWTYRMIIPWGGPFEVWRVRSSQRVIPLQFIEVIMMISFLHLFLLLFGWVMLLEILLLWWSISSTSILSRCGGGGWWCRSQTPSQRPLVVPQSSSLWRWRRRQVTHERLIVLIE